MKKTKRLVAVGWALALAVVLAGCAPAVAPPAAAPAEAGAAAPAEEFEWVTPERVGDPNAPIVLRVALDVNYSHQSTTQRRVDYLTAKYEAWTRANPDVQLVFEPYTGDIPQDHARLLELASTGRRISLCWMGSWFASFSSMCSRWTNSSHRRSWPIGSRGRVRAA